MAPSRTYPFGLKLKVTVILAFIFCLTIPLLNSDAQGLPFSRNSEINLQQRKMVLGSKPPGCVNKCFSCRPCMATLVVPSHQKKSFPHKALPRHDDDDGDGYYLLSWKCKCGDKLFQP